MVESNLSPARPAPARYALFVDVGYLYAASGQLLLGANSRREYRVQAEPLIKALQQRAAKKLDGELLRVYWYDAARNRVATIDQRVVAPLSYVKLRLGNLNAHGQQKGVDAQIRVDLEALARNQAVTDAVLIAGDEDTVPAVEAAQAYGVRIHLWGIEPPYGTNQAERLVWESDTSEVLEPEFLRPYFELVSPRVAAAEPQQKAASTVPSPAQVFAGRTQATSPVRPAAPVGNSATGSAAVTDQHAPVGSVTAPLLAGSSSAAARLDREHERVKEIGEHVAQQWILTRGHDNIRDLLPGPMLPPVIDKELLVEAEKELGYSLRPYQQAREGLRDGFWERVYREFDLGHGTSPE